MKLWYCEIGLYWTTSPCQQIDYEIHCILLNSSTASAILENSSIQVANSRLSSPRDSCEPWVNIGLLNWIM